MQNRKRIEMLKAAAIVAAFYGFLQLLGITCPIKFITGISCPGTICSFKRRMVSKPSISGIRTSKRIKSGLFSLTYSSSARPDRRAVTRI